jgi:hypothetical protein
MSRKWPKEWPSCVSPLSRPPMLAESDVTMLANGRRKLTPSSSRRRAMCPQTTRWSLRMNFILFKVCAKSLCVRYNTTTTDTRIAAQNSSLAPPPGPPPFPTFISARVSGFNVEPSTAPLMLPPSTSTVGPTCISVNHASTSATPPLPRTPSIAPLGLASSTRYAHKPAGNTHAPVVYSTSQRPPSRPDPTLSSTFSTGAAPRPPPTILSSRSDNIVRRTYVSDVSDPRKDPAYEDPSPAERTPPPAAHASAVPGKRRLGMGRSAVGYNPKKKFRPPL